MPDFDLRGALAGFQRSAWRLETLDHYESPAERESFEHFRRTGHALPRTDGWLELVAGHVAAGRHMGRVHAISRPLTPYVEYEIAMYEHHAAAGEVIEVADRSLHRDHLTGLCRDFWVFDGERVAVLEYDRDGRFAGITDGTPDLQVWLAVQAEAIRVAVPLGSWMGRAVGQ